MKIFIQLIYSCIALPIACFFVLLASTINYKIRYAVRERFKINQKIKNYLQAEKNDTNRVIIHCASMGEFEHIKPLIHKLSGTPNISIIITFFSPSGYDHVKKFEGVDLIIYAPFDFSWSWKKLLSSLNPKMMIISKHDAWPNQVWVAKKQKLPLFLVNASLSENSSRINGIAGFLYKYIYPEFDAIYCVSNGDQKRFESFYPGTKAFKMGDTKFDQVRLRKELSQGRNLISADWRRGKAIFLLGSIWPEDFEILKDPLIETLKKCKNLKLVLVPHQPVKEFIDVIIAAFPDEAELFSNHNNKSSKRILIVNKIGILADLYKYADLAYVGGSFKQGIHNVMEPAIYGLPVLYGPIHKNSYDAVKLLEHDGGRVVTSKSEVLVELLNLLEKPEYRTTIGQNALAFAQKHTGTTDKLIQLWEPYLK